MSDSATAQVADPVWVPPETPHRTVAKGRGRSRSLDFLLLSRLRRRRQIRQIEAATGRTLLCYVSRGQPIVDQDIEQLRRLLEKIEPRAPITLLLNSPGGEIGAAEKMVRLLLETRSDSPGAFEVVVPDYAKSVATLVALGAGRIFMSVFSELGQIDPHIRLANGSRVSVFTYLLAYEAAVRRSKEHPMVPAFADALAKFDPALMAAIRQVVSKARTCAEDLLKRRGVDYAAAVDALMDRDRHFTDGPRIDSRTAKAIGLTQVHHEDLRSESWRRYWRLYLELAAVSGNDRRVFESRRLSLVS